MNYIIHNNVRFWLTYRVITAISWCNDSSEWTTSNNGIFPRRCYALITFSIGTYGNTAFSIFNIIIQNKWSSCYIKNIDTVSNDASWRLNSNTDLGYTENIRI